jgi:5-formyltetrahydrofolate cyclo-ligase
MDKRAARRDCFSKLKSLSLAEKRVHSGAIAHHIAETKEFRESKCVFTYCAMPSEPDLSELFRDHQDKIWGFSRIEKNARISFRHVQTPEDLSEGAVGFLEPDPDRCPLLSVSRPDLMLVPGVGFDRGNLARLGRGKGHYDRYLQSAILNGTEPSIFGICFSIQRTNLTPDSHDIPMSAIYTELGRA